MRRLNRSSYTAYFVSNTIKVGWVVSTSSGAWIVLIRPISDMVEISNNFRLNVAISQSALLICPRKYLSFLGQTRERRKGTEVVGVVRLELPPEFRHRLEPWYLFDG